MAQKYDDSSIQILEGLEAVRKRPGMYIGSTDAHGLHHLIWEITDNAVDEAINGYGKKITITLEADGSCTVTDEGRGMPCGMHASGKNTLEVIFTVLHAGGKFTSTGGYKTAGGLHGVGASVVNALSEWLTVETAHEGQLYRMQFSDGGKKIGKLEKLGKTNRHGSIVRFKPDPAIFTTTDFKYDVVCERAREEAFLLSGISIVVADKRAKKPQEETFCYEDGLIAFLNYLHEDKNVLMEPVKFAGDYEGIHVDVAFQYNDGYQENTYSFVNLVRTPDGGTHEMGFKTAFTKAVNDYARKYGLLKEKDKNLEGSDVREGLTTILSVSIPEEQLQFEGQTKGKLGTPEAKPAVDAVVSQKLAFWLEENKSQSDELIRKMQKAAQARVAARKARDAARAGKRVGKNERLISGKLAPAQTKDAKIKELFLVEGDSAGGSAKQGRDSHYQAILPLRGKVLNTEKCSLSDIEKNEELNTLIYTIGAGVGADFDYTESSYNKVIIMTDADDDGSHIQILLLTFFYRYMRQLLEHGMVYIALPPLYKVSKGKKSAYCYSDDELNALRGKWGKCEIQRYKGLGEMNASQLWETTMDPASRTLIKVGIDDNSVAEKRVSVLMGDKPEKRRRWIEENVSFTLEDNFKVE
ncbi:MAG: DNA topoisomerase IV subunit B [Solobacterium sp.]|jgi:topoisomerase-4 subunit B|nr:DNA topoisomerase IV subunit B [Solobacterium sp.]MCH4047934.1 DNA topoisomerase IV subunit B [Solobacterium sp.]MCH4075480.1 DNA topoisomerase IV subunit B [Solobacterium sp.]MCI1313647.1 DNA topoisomerase IV subunit B [Solobacterium sp.]MCI1346216.1 DNA topoisomerase IV subunit B [Solobacterium sp.]